MLKNMSWLAIIVVHTAESSRLPKFRCVFWFTHRTPFCSPRLFRGALQSIRSAHASKSIRKSSNIYTRIELQGKLDSWPILIHSTFQILFWLDPRQSLSASFRLCTEGKKQGIVTFGVAHFLQIGTCQFLSNEKPV